MLFRNSKYYPNLRYVGSGKISCQTNARSVLYYNWTFMEKSLELMVMKLSKSWFTIAHLPMLCLSLAIAAFASASVAKSTSASPRDLRCPEPLISNSILIATGFSGINHCFTSVSFAENGKPRMCTQCPVVLLDNPPPDPPPCPKPPPYPPESSLPLRIPPYPPRPPRYLK